MDTSELFFLIKFHIKNQFTTYITKHSCHHIDRDDRHYIWGLARQVLPFSTKNNSPSFIIRRLLSLSFPPFFFCLLLFHLFGIYKGFWFLFLILFFFFYCFLFLVEFQTLNMFESLKTSVSWYP